MKKKLYKTYNDYWYYNISYCFQEQYDYVFKYLDFDKLYKGWFIGFNNEEIEEWFYETYIEENCLKDIYNRSPEGYGWLKNNWGKGIFELYIWYKNKQELKTIINKIINIELIRG